MTRLYRCLALITLTWLIGSCGGADSVVGPPPAPKVGSITVSQDTATLVPAATLQLSAAAKSVSGEVLQRTFSWTTSDPASATVSNSGLVVGVAPGAATISAAADGKSATARVIVLEGGVVSGSGATLTLQSGAVQLVVPADALTSNTNLWVVISSPFVGDPELVMGSSFDFGPSGTNFAKPVVLKIRYNPATLPSGTAEGSLELYLKSSSGWEVVPQSVVDPTAKTVSAPISHFSTYAIRRPVPVATVTLSATTTPMGVGATQQVSAVTRDANGNVLTGRLVTWVSSNTAVLTVSASGLVTASGQGTATITATSESVSATSPVITVNPAPPPAVATVTVSPPSASLLVGGKQQLTAVTRDAAGNVLTGRTIGWSSSNAAVASVDGNGLVTAVNAGGPVTITATSEGKTGTSSITVTAPALTLRASPFITSGLSAPVFLTQPLNDGRIFVVEQAGRIRVVINGVLQSTPFLDISSKVIYSGEQGLLSMAFHPQYATNHFFYVYFTGLSGEIRIVRFTTTSDPSVADPASEKLIFTTPHSDAGNHNGGLTAFGPDGMLYAAFGDGGGGGDPFGNGQNFNAYLGGMIRIDVDHGDPYSVPADNPFIGVANRRPELWAKGLRNPWRYAFDPPTGLLFIADVGQGLHEEVDAVPATQGGVNYGWNIMEGFSCYGATNCNQTGLQLPVLDYGHTGGACSITGGYVYRGNAMSAIQGHYFYSDYCAGWLRSLRYQNGVAVDQKDWGITLAAVTSFGQDASGELYVLASNSIYKLVPGP